MLLFRLSLSVLRYNENSDRLQKVTVDGRPRYYIKYPKAKKGGYALQPVKSPPTYGTFIQFKIPTLINKIGRMSYVKQVFFLNVTGTRQMASLEIINNYIWYLQLSLLFYTQYSNHWNIPLAQYPLKHLKWSFLYK